MSENPETITHDGVVKNVGENLVVVSIIAKSACISCAINSVCNSGETGEKLIEIKHKGENYKIGDKVRLSMASALGFRALFLGYLLPFFIIVTVIVLGSLLFENEGIVSGLALLFAVVYYLILYFNKDLVAQKFTYKMEKI